MIMATHKTTPNASSNSSVKTEEEFNLINETTGPLLTCLSLVCLLVNVTIISLFLIDPLRSLRRPSGYLVASLNVGALLTSISTLALALNGLQKTNVVSMKVIFTIFVITITASFFFIFILSYERYVLITAPIKYKTIATVRRAQILALFTWICTAAVGVLMSELFFLSGNFWSSVPGGIAFLILVAIDIKTFMEIKKKSSSIDGMTEEGQQRPSLSEAMKSRIDLQRKFARVVVLLLVNFTVFASPMFVSNYIIQFNKKCKSCLFTKMCDEETIYAASIAMFLCHDINAALFYLILIPKYRMSFLAIFRKCNTVAEVFFH